MTTHPLAALRTSTGLSQAEYAQLVARTHAELGHGRMAARREKVSRWESGRIAPEFTAQLAIARIHLVDTDLVLRLGWPRWLTATVGDHDLLHQPWTPHGAMAVTRLTAATAGDPRPGLAAVGSSLTAQIRGAITALDGNARPPQRNGPHITPETLTWAEHRIRALERLETGSPSHPAALRLAARTEHQLISDLLSSHGYDRILGTELLLLAARTAALCTWTSHVLGEDAQAERFNLAAIRAASAAGAPHRTAAHLAQLAFRHRHHGHPRDVLSLVQAARTIDPHPTPRLATVLHTHQALALARLAQPTTALRAMDHAEHALATAPPQWDPNADPAGATIDENYLAVSHGSTQLALGEPTRALTWFSALLNTGTPTRRHPTPYAVTDLSLVVQAQLAAGQTDEAASTVRHAVDRSGNLPPGLADRFRALLAPHTHQPPVQAALAHLAARTRPRTVDGRVPPRRAGHSGGPG
ncbi:hypothetical protein [Kitasatospora sp. NPDC094011]|uniref:hypothetical protein n=1 Tax=Kitasatospora sp. NPDC094011 TaxID=3364090 RepID=UPI0037F556E8